MKREPSDFDQDFLISRTERAKRQVDSAIKRARSLEQDSDRDERLRRHLCKACHYFAIERGAMTAHFGEGIGMFEVLDVITDKNPLSAFVNAPDLYSWLGVRYARGALCVSREQAWEFVVLNLHLGAETKRVAEALRGGAFASRH